MGARTRGVQALACALVLAFAGCGDNPGSAGAAGAKPGASASSAPAGKDAPSAGASSGAATPGKPGESTGTSKPEPLPQDVKLDSPGKLSDPLLSSDVLVYSQNTLDASSVAKIKAIKDVSRVEPISMGSFFADDREVTYAAVDPATFRRFTTPGTAQTDEVWDRVAGGEMAIEPRLGKKIADQDGYVRLGNDADAKRPARRRLRADPGPVVRPSHRRRRQLRLGREARHAQGQRR